MSIKYIIPVLLFFVLLSALSVAYSTAQTADTAATRIEVDEANSLIRIVIDGKEIGFIDQTGFYVHGDIAYTGVIVDGLPKHVREGRNVD